MRKLDYFWMSNKKWYERKENLVPVINQDAPPEAQASYQHYLEQLKRIEAESDKSMD